MSGDVQPRKRKDKRRKKGKMYDSKIELVMNFRNASRLPARYF